MTKILAICIAILSLWFLPDIRKPEDNLESIISSSVTAIRSQSKLSVLSVTLNSEGKSKTTILGLTASRTDVVKTPIDYYLDLTKFKRDYVSIKSDTLYVTLPRDYLQVKIHQSNNIYSTKEGYLALSLPFVDVDSKLTKKNNKLITKNLNYQIESTREIGYQSAIVALENLFQIPLEASNSKLKVKVRFD